MMSSITHAAGQHSLLNQAVPAEGVMPRRRVFLAGFVMLFLGCLAETVARSQGGLPNFISVPSDPTIVGLGESVTFTVVVEGEQPIGLRWRVGGNTLHHAFSEGRTNHFTIPSVQFSDEGTYSVVATNSVFWSPGILSPRWNLVVVSNSLPECTYVLSPESRSHGAGSSVSAFTIDSPDSCNWVAETADDWIHTSSTGSGNGTVSYFLAANPNASTRVGSISVEGAVFVVSQAGVDCRFGLTPFNAGHGPGMEAGGFSIQSRAGCGWSASSPNEWIHTSDSGTGNGTVSYTVDANPTATSRSGVIFVADVEFVVTQVASSCGYSVSPPTDTIESSGGMGSFQVVATKGCPWSASSSVPWIQSISVGNGDGTVHYLVEANPGSSPRSGTIRVLGEIFSLTQSGQQEPTVLVPWNAVWRYDLSGSNFDSPWREIGYDDSTWSSGPAPLGFPAMEQTPLGVLSDVGTVFSTHGADTTLYRHSFEFSGDPTAVTLLISNFVDDGCVVFLDGSEIARFGMEGVPDPITDDALATRCCEVGENRIDWVAVPGSELSVGDNVLAVQVHEVASGDGDVLQATAVSFVDSYGPEIFYEPRDLIVTEGRTVAISVEAAGWPPPTFEWYHDSDGPGGTPPILLRGATESTYVFTAASPADGGYYFARVQGHGSAESRWASVTVVPDTHGPRLVSAVGQPDLTTVLVTFDEPLETDPALSRVESPFVYVLLSRDGSPGILMSSAVVTNATNVILTTSASRDPLKSYTLYLVPGFVSDRFGNTIDQPLNTIPLTVRIPLVGLGANWEYDQSGTDLGTAWLQPGAPPFAASGPGLLGQADAGSALPLVQTDLTSRSEGGPNSTYFRTQFIVPGIPSDVFHLNLSYYADDAVVVYINGTEVHRSRFVPNGPVGFSTRADGVIVNAEQEGPYLIEPSALLPGLNVLQAHVIQADVSSSDIVWGGELSAISEQRPDTTLKIRRLITGNFEISWTAGPGWGLYHASSPDGAYALFGGSNLTSPVILSSAFAGTLTPSYYQLLKDPEGPEDPEDMSAIPPAEFEMGDAFGQEFDELPRHSVEVDGFFMDKYEVTSEKWREVHDWALAQGYQFENVGASRGGGYPIRNLNWYDAVKWCNARSEKENLRPAYYTDTDTSVVYRVGRTEPFVDWTTGYRLPTEAEWESAARGGLSGERYPWGDTINHTQANYYSYWPNGQPYPYDVNPSQGYHPDYSTSGQPYTAPVGQFAPNAYGLYDMTGNVWEWCWDWYGEYSSTSQTNPRGPASGTERLRRGGGWDASAWYQRVSKRLPREPETVRSNLGFRCVRPRQVQQLIRR